MLRCLCIRDISVPYVCTDILKYNRIYVWRIETQAAFTNALEETAIEKALWVDGSLIPACFREVILIVVWLLHASPRLIVEAFDEQRQRTNFTSRSECKWLSFVLLRHIREHETNPDVSDVLTKVHTIQYLQNDVKIAFRRLNDYIDHSFAKRNVLEFFFLCCQATIFSASWNWAWSRAGRLCPLLANELVKDTRELNRPKFMSILTSSCSSQFSNVYIFTIIHANLPKHWDDEKDVFFSFLYHSFYVDNELKVNSRIEFKGIHESFNFTQRNFEVSAISWYGARTISIFSHSLKSILDLEDSPILDLRMRFFYILVSGVWLQRPWKDDCLLNFKFL